MVFQTLILIQRIQQWKSLNHFKVVIAIVRMERFGLLSSDRHIPLKSVRVTGIVQNFSSEIVLEQTYKNDDSNPIEVM